VTAAQRRKHDLAYACFLVPGAISLASAIPMGGEAAGALGFMVLVPLALLALVTIPIGIFYSAVLWRDGVLPCLSILTVLLIVEVMTESGSVAFYNAATGPVYGMLVLVLEASWFLWRRRRAVQVA
jgi:hypothetical protein